MVQAAGDPVSELAEELPETYRRRWQRSPVCMKFCSQLLSRPVLFWAATWSPLAGSSRRAGACSRQRPRQTTCSLTLTAVKEPRTEIFKVPDRRTAATKVPTGTGITDLTHRS